MKLLSVFIVCLSIQREPLFLRVSFVLWEMCVLKYSHTGQGSTTTESLLVALLETSGIQAFLFLSCVFIININNKCCSLGPSSNSTQLKKTIYCLMWSSQLSPLASIPFPFVVTLHRLLSGGLIRGFGGSDRTSSAKQWLLCSDYTYVRSGH